MFLWTSSFFSSSFTDDAWNQSDSVWCQPKPQVYGLMDCYKHTLEVVGRIQKTCWSDEEVWWEVLFLFFKVTLWIFWSEKLFLLHFWIFNSSCSSILLSCSLSCVFPLGKQAQRKALKLKGLLCVLVLPYTSPLSVYLALSV